MSWYDPNFDKAFGEQLITAVQKQKGCFACGKSCVSLNKCSRCKVAIYCDKRCQKADWKTTHKEHCSIYMENKDLGGPTGEAPMPLLLRSIHLLSDDSFRAGMDTRLDLFAALASNSDQKGSICISFAGAVVPTFGKLQLLVDGSFFNDVTGEVVRVPHLLVKVVDDDEKAVKRWLPNKTLSKKAFDKLVGIWAGLINRLQKAGIETTGITCGSGMVFRVDELEEKLKAKGITLNGPGIIPSAMIF